MFNRGENSTSTNRGSWTELPVCVMDFIMTTVIFIYIGSQVIRQSIMYLFPVAGPPPTDKDFFL
jgi:hypothetical protein